MKKIYEVPVYALSKTVLTKRVNNKITKIRDLCHSRGCDETTTNAAIRNETFPMRCWDYNHIVGYIRISVSTMDVFFDLFLPYGNKNRYYWDSKNKTLLYDNKSNGLHFRVSHNMTNGEIGQKIIDTVSLLIKNKYINSRYVVDSSVLKNTYMNMDFKKIMQNAGEIG